MYTVTLDISASYKKLNPLEKKGIIKILGIRRENNKNRPSAILATPGFGKIRPNAKWFGSLEQTRVFNKLKKIIGIQNIEDCISLEAHIRDERDFFITEDHHYLDKRLGSRLL